MNKIFCLIFALLMCISPIYSAEPPKPQFEVLSSGACGKVTCLILKDNEGDYLLAIGDKDGLIQIWFKGVSVWRRVVA